MERRTYLVTAGIGTSSLLAGCLSDGPSDDESDGDDEPDPDGGESEPESEPDYEQVIETYLEAAQAEDPDAMAAVVHSASPLQGILTDPEWEFESSGAADLDALETEVVTADGSVADVRGLEGAAFWFAQSDLEAEIDDAEIVLVRAELDDAAAGDSAGVYALVTEDEEWKIFWVESGDDSPENPEDAFEPEIIDTDEDVVERIEWGVDAVDAPEGSDVETGYYARVHLTDSPGREADLLRIESTIAGSTFEFYGESKDEPSTSWAGTWTNVRLNTDGDQIVVTAVRGDTETVVHREHYEPSD
ncbi:hypothetical protein C488_17396 [Natrinema pellirubrum DSM 15624]|uniref:Uncharacterized protein n=1 Tax=Natrinema pellirubrum (strain DSM 15624 / CIP 106293 / JCM 10476 / NCIMB 786 / 157) TaxID=797303 RepID=L0JSL6_NATP1|nr:hypothetical protein [Natrinema pellirubrum]AGB33356.1 hypothetical protein Natpe_3589 [Natrinema pellirubrum DSM 15624]ELY71480.1 hypothetical protein C488_17396 [Natrinema pellirubrum DSM 15624]